MMHIDAGFQVSRLSVKTLFFFNDTATTEIYTLSLHDALPIFNGVPFSTLREDIGKMQQAGAGELNSLAKAAIRSEEHTSELQSQSNLVCRLLLEKKRPASSVRPLRRACRARLRPHFGCRSPTR